MIPRPQHFGDRASFPCHWSGIVRIFQETLFEALLLTAGGRAHYPGEKPYARVEDDHSAKLSARKDIVTHGNGLDLTRLEDPLIESFKAAAEENDALARRKLAHPGLRQRRATRRQRKHWPIVGDAIERRSQNVRSKHHPCASAGWRVVNAAMLVRGKIPDVRRFKAPDTLGKRPAGKASAERTREHVRVQRQHRGAEAPLLCLRLVSVAPKSPPTHANSMNPPPIVITAETAKSSICSLCP